MNFFINQPIFATAIALITILIGGISAIFLPVGEYPPISPTEVEITANYDGASAEVVARSVTTPIEEQVNGVEGMIYMSSNSTNNGQSTITATFEVGYDPSIAQADVLNRVTWAEPHLPLEVTRSAVQVKKTSDYLIALVNLISPNGTFDQDYLGNYAEIHVADRLRRISGIASVWNQGFRKYALRVWLDPNKLTNLGLTPMDVTHAIREQNRQVAAGVLGGAPAPVGQPFELQLQALGRLSTVAEFEDIILRADPDGSVVRLRDVARVELGSESYDAASRLNGKPAAALVLFQRPGANLFAVVQQVNETMRSVARYFPEDLEYVIPYDTSNFVSASIESVIQALLLAIVLVFLVIYVFLQSWRATFIPAFLIPVSLIGAFAFMAILGFSINTLSMLGLLLAVGLVVDDAIVVVENVQRHMEGGSSDRKEIVKRAMAEVRGPIVATTLALISVFVPVAFIPGLTGQLYNQFALTIAIAVGLSGINALTLSPALCAVFLRARTESPRAFFRGFNRLFQQTINAYAQGVKHLSRVWYLTLAVFIALGALTLYLFQSIPTAFVPDENQGIIIVAVQAPNATTIEQAKSVMAQVTHVLLGIDGIKHVQALAGYNLLDGINQPNAGTGFALLDPWGGRKQATAVDAVIERAQAAVDGIPGAEIVLFHKPPIPGVGATGGLNLELQDLNSLGPDQLAAAAREFLKRANARPEIGRAFTTFDAGFPERYVDVDRTKAKSLGVSIEDLFRTLQINLGALYVNDFNKFGRTYKVFVQAEKDTRSSEKDLTNLRVRNSSGKMIELSGLVTMNPVVGPFNITHYNLYPSVSINALSAPGYSSGEAVRALEDLAHELPRAFGFEWTGTVFQQIKAGKLAPIIFTLSVIFVFLVLAAQYESWTMPFVVITAVPFGLLGGIAALLTRGLALDIFGQIGLLLLIGLTVKNAILIVQFAAQNRAQGASVLDSAMEAARIRLRPILMTALVFVCGVIPLALATGASANSQHSMGITVIGGMLVSTLLIIIVPVFYVLVERLREHLSEGNAGPRGKSAAPHLEREAE